MSDRKTRSNRTNALQSTGPVTVIGKARASQNAIQHGILSAKLLLPSENQNEYAALLSQLQLELVAVGTLECASVAHCSYLRQLLQAVNALEPVRPAAAMPA